MKNKNRRRQGGNPVRGFIQPSEKEANSSGRNADFFCFVSKVFKS